MSTIHPEHSAFTVAVNFKGTIYDVEIKPTLNGKPIKWMQDRVDQWNRVERTHQLFSQKIVQMLENTTVVADSLESLGEVTGVDKFSFAAPESMQATQVIWEDFIRCLLDPVSETAGREPVAEDAGVLGPGAGITSTRNAYLNLSSAKQQETRLNLFIKKCYEHFASKYHVEIPEHAEYSSAEKACLKHLLYSNSFSPKLRPVAEASIIFWKKLSDDEKNAVASYVTIIDQEMKQKARQPVADDSELRLDSDSEIDADLSNSDEELDILSILAHSDSKKDVKSLSRSLESVRSDSNVLLMSGNSEIDLSDEDEFSFSDSFS